MRVLRVTLSAPGYGARKRRATGVVGRAAVTCGAPTKLLPITGITERTLTLTYLPVPSGLRGLMRRTRGRGCDSSSATSMYWGAGPYRISKSGPAGGSSVNSTSITWFTGTLDASSVERFTARVDGTAGVLTLQP